MCVSITVSTAFEKGKCLETHSKKACDDEFIQYEKL